MILEKYFSNKCIVTFFLVFISSFLLSIYLNTQNVAATRIVVLFISCISAIFFLKNRKECIFRKINIVFSILLGISIILGYHLHIDSYYNGTIDTEYIYSFHFIDVLALIFISFIIYIIISSVSLLTTQKSNEISGFLFKNEAFENIKPTKVLLEMIPFILISLIYLLMYYPGFIFGDSLESIGEALGYRELLNHHPYMYTMFIKLCLHLGNALGGGNTLGCAIYSIIQSIYLSFCYSYYINWTVSRFHIKKYLEIIMVLFYSLTPYIASYSITMWKDPIFVATLLLISLFNFDYEFGIKEKCKKSLIPYFLLIIIAIFVRSNGLYVIIFMEFIWLIIYLMNRKKIEANQKFIYKSIITGIIMIIIFTKIITGPIYKAIGVKQVKVESVGIFLNQMARVAAYDGDMTDAEKEYMNSLLPLDMYKSTYRPGCVDKLKWSPSFNSKKLNEDFFLYWFSIGTKNIKLYIESWEFMTAGYWGVNIPASNRRLTNISSGDPTIFNSTSNSIAESYGIYSKSFINSTTLKQIFTYDEWSIPAAWIHWLIFYILLLLLFSKTHEYYAFLAPSIGVIITLFLASPIIYWPRYCALEQIMLPIYLLILIKSFQKQNYCNT